MKIYDIILLILAIAITVAICVSLIAMVWLKVPTTPENEQIRIKLIDLMTFVAGGILAIIAKKN